MDDEREILTPLAGLRRRAEHGGAQAAPGSVPTRALLTWGEPIFEQARTYSRAKPTDLKAGVAKLYRGTWGGETFVLVNPGVGSASTALVVEKLHACGVDTFVGVGFAGILHPLLQSGDIVVAERALGEDGVTRAYLDGTDESRADPTLKAALELSLGEDPGASYQCGTVWTTDAPYRETVAKARAYRARGAQAVDMETASLFSVAARRGFRAVALLVLSDSLCRVAPLEAPLEPGSDGLAWEWTPAPPGSLEGKVGALVRAALPVVTGPLRQEPAAAHAP